MLAVKNTNDVFVPSHSHMSQNHQRMCAKSSAESLGIGVPSSGLSAASALQQHKTGEGRSANFDGEEEGPGDT